METIPLGVLVDRNIIRATLAGHVPYENLDLYRRGAPCQVCFFSFADLDLPHRAVNAYILDANGGLTRRRVGLPPVIHYRAVAASHADKQLAGNLARMRGPRLFNTPHVSGKWNHCRWLRAEPDLNLHVPETRRYDGERSLVELLSHHKAVVLKRIWGSMGIGIIRVRRTPSGFIWECGTGAVHPCRTLAEVVVGIRGQTSNHDYIVQQSLELAMCRGHRFDMRCAVQRDGTGEWQFVGSSARLAGKDRIATNVARGGSGMKTMPVLRAVLGESASERMADVKSLAMRAAEVLGQRERHLADLGLDIAISADGRVWFLEANSRQMRYSFRLSRQWPQYRACYRLPMEYGYSLLPPSMVPPSLVPQTTAKLNPGPDA